MDKLTKEEVLHIANLGRLELSNEEIEKYSYELKSLLDEIERINDVEETTSEIMINPVNNECILTNDKDVKIIDNKEVLKNAPCTFEDYIEVRGVFDE